jgi:hypothetical protein
MEITKIMKIFKPRERKEGRNKDGREEKEKRG